MISLWPNLKTPWKLKTLTIFSSQDKNDLFEGKQLNLVFPKLESLYVFLSRGQKMTVPDKSMIKSLSEIRLRGGGTFIIQTDSNE